MSQEIRIGVLALTDSAPFVAAQHMGYFSDCGLNVQLVRQPSWSTLRDKLVYGEIDAAHMLAPMAIAVQLGLGGSPRKAMHVPLVLNRGGNAITVSNDLAARLDSLPVEQTLGSSLRAARARGERTLVLATVFRFSMHTLQLRRWLRANDIDPDTDVRVEVLPPARMVNALRSGVVDGFCVGEPYSSFAVNEQLGRMVATSASLWPNAPEKVLGCTQAWALQNPGALAGLTGALSKACQWLEGGQANRQQAAHWLSLADHVNLPEAVLQQALLGTVGGQALIRFDGSALDVAQRALLEPVLAETLALSEGALDPFMLDEAAQPFLPIASQ